MSNSRKQKPKSKEAFQRDATEILKAWYLENKHFPFPTEEKKQNLTKLTGLTLDQVD